MVISCRRDGSDFWSTLLVAALQFPSQCADVPAGSVIEHVGVVDGCIVQRHSNRTPAVVVCKALAGASPMGVGVVPTLALLIAGRSTPLKFRVFFPRKLINLQSAYS